MSQISKGNGRVTEERRALFREVNDRIVGLGGFAGGEQVLILCECGSTGCEDRIELSKEEYTELRSFPTHYAVVTGHSSPGRILKQHSCFAVVEG